MRFLPSLPCRLCRAAAALALLALAGPRGARAQAGRPEPLVRVSGTVSEAPAGRQPVPGASVQVQRTRRGVLADRQGDFFLTALPTDTLVFRAIGFKPHRLVLGGTTLSQLVVQVKLVRDSVQLGEVRVTADRPDRAQINRALRNIRRPAPPVVKIPKRPARPKPLFEVDTTGPKRIPPDLGSSNVDWLYEQLSRQGRQRRKLEQLQQEDARRKAQEQAARQRADYNRHFQDNRGYE